jgi:NAD(P)H-hydrate epimerase
VRPVFSREQSRAFDAYAITTCRVPGVILMENAGRGAADVIARDVLSGAVRGATIAIVCGTGNNGGDGFVIARHLVARGADVRVFLAGAPGRLSGDARVNHDAYVGIGGTVTELATDADRAALPGALASARVIVDALFGTGLDRALTGATIDVVRTINAAPGTRVAVDLPSGLDADTGAALGACVAADVTITFGHLKLGLLTPHGASAAGAVHVVDIGVPDALPAVPAPAAHRIERADVARLVPPRKVDAHKHSVGHVAVLGGSDGKIGAPLMVARAALRAGAGLATIATWAECAPALQSRVLEEMTASLSRTDIEGSVTAALKGKRALVVGPGFGLDADARRAIEIVLRQWKGPVLFDADALTAFAGDASPFASSTVPAILTPHAGELARLLGFTSQAVEADRYGAARALARSARAVVVLKGASTLIADASGRVVVNASGNATLATAGSGDTLAGIIGALACALDPFDAACAGVYVHGLAADAWKDRHGDRGLLASEIADLVPDMFRALTGEHTRGPV